MATRQARRAASRSTEVDEREPRGRNRPRPPRAKRSRRLRRRYAVVYDIDGPRVRLGILWFVVAAVGARRRAAPHRASSTAAPPRSPPPRRPACGAGAGSAPTRSSRPAWPAAWRSGACLGAGGAGLGVLGGVAAALRGRHRRRRGRRNPIAHRRRLDDPVRAVPVGLAAMSMVLLTRLDQGSAIALLLLVSAYETGDYLVGSGARNPYEGPAAGLAAIVVVTFIVSTLRSRPRLRRGLAVRRRSSRSWRPLGQLFASALLPTAGAPPPRLRRLDSLLLAAPVWWLRASALVHSDGGSPRRQTPRRGSRRRSPS